MTGHIHAIVGPRDAGPGERQAMLEMARDAIGEVEELERIDVPGRGAGDDGEGSLRTEVEPLIPALQSGSLFGGSRGVLVVDAQNLQKAEAEIVAGLVETLDPETARLALVSIGSLPAVLAKVVKAVGEVASVKKMRERDAIRWLVAASRERKVKLADGAAQALVRHFGSDIASLGQALDQLSASPQPVTGEEVEKRFRNRPDEPMWHFADAVADGDAGEALRRLADFLTHGHPLQLLAFVEGDLKRRAMAVAAPDIETLAEWLGSSTEHYPVKKAWQARSRVTDAELRRAVEAVARADLVLKTHPEATHRLTMERLTVALCRWYS
jgi:DNA polymerase III delta subunit